MTPEERKEIDAFAARVAATFTEEGRRFAALLLLLEEKGLITLEELDQKDAELMAMGEAEKVERAFEGIKKVWKGNA